ncbi:hypothetical protein DyAD56_02695 [Dyella sp. AD56]|uniref:DUF5329 domain-containing protein n=1 Tax=Dyella sp. AD56 TaxID=1528744 RepID=UPI000CC99D0E|nr:DUF5329 domain-containing protein [Dyella sp. AD56]PMQ06799.1 hypothetical protein DyAD56_02695 [Dyella sp. AD56]
MDGTVTRLRELIAATLLAYTSIFLVLPVHAESDDASQREIAALLSFVGHSSCTFIRNGTAYPATQAEGHLEDKLHYLQRKGKVHSAEDFIQLAATESSMSGKPYLVRCDGKEQPSADWLNEELTRLRNAGS